MLTLLVSTISAAQQDLFFGFKGGVNFVSSGEQASPSWVSGYSVGGFAEWRPFSTVAFEPDLLYSIKGIQAFIREDAAEKTSGSSFTQNLAYLDFPVLVKCYLRSESPSVNLCIGPSVSWIVSARANIDRLFTRGDVLNGSIHTDFGFMVGSGISVSTPQTMLTLDLRYNYGLRQLQGANGGGHNQAISILAGVGL